MIKTYKDLMVYKHSFKMSMDIFCFIQSFPKQEMYSLASQVMCSSRSVSTHIVEAINQKLETRNQSSLYFFITILLYLLTSSITNAQTLGHYLQEAANNNPGLKAKYAEFEAALERIPQVKALPDPTISIGYFVSSVETRVGAQKAKVSLSQMFPWFGTLAAKKDKATWVAEAKFQEFQEEKNKLFLKVKNAYYPLYEINEHIIKQQENLDILKTYKALTTNAFANSKSTMTDVIRVDIMMGNIETEIQLLNHKIKPLEVRFNHLLNRDNTDKRLEFADSLSIFSLEENYRKDSLLAQNPILKAMDLRIKSAKAQGEVAMKMGLPKLGLGLDYALVTARNDIYVPDNGKDIFMPMLSMSLPISRKKYKASVREAQFEQVAFKERREDISDQLLSSYQQAWYEMEENQQLEKLYKQQITKTQQIIDLLYTAYSNSGKDFEEILKMQQQLLKYEMAKATALKNFYLALAKLDYLTAKSL